ncbi:MAG: hypothetical protein BJ554DRAFT_5298, partial [Olpidium bornovanus]
MGRTILPGFTPTCSGFPWDFGERLPPLSEAAKGQRGYRNAATLATKAGAAGDRLTPKAATGVAPPPTPRAPRLFPASFPSPQVARKAVVSVVTQAVKFTAAPQR